MYVRLYSYSNKHLGKSSLDALPSTVLIMRSCIRYFFKLNNVKVLRQNVLTTVTKKVELDGGKVKSDKRHVIPMAVVTFYLSTLQLMLHIY